MNYYRSKGGGQFFKLNPDTEEVIIVCEYEFNLMIEKTRIRETTLLKLQMDEIDEETFNDARNRVSLLLNQF